MESITVPSETSPAESAVGKSTAHTIRTQDRVTLGKTESLKVDAWIVQVSESTRGFLNLSRSDLVNYLVRSVANDLSQKSLSQIRVEHYDPIRHITWIAPQIKAALADHDHERVASLQAELRSVDLSGANKPGVVESVASPRVSLPRVKRRKRNADVASVTESSDGVTNSAE